MVLAWRQTTSVGTAPLKKRIAMYDQNDFSSPILGPLFRLMRMQQFAQDRKWQEEQRGYEREFYKAQLEEHHRNRLLGDVNTALTLQAAGAMPVGPNAGQLEAAVKPIFGEATPGNERPLIKAPSDQSWRLPSYNERRAMTEAAARREGKLKGIEKSSEEEVTNPYVDTEIETGLPPPFNRSTKKVREKQVAAVVKAAHERANPKLTYHWTQPNDAGESTGIAFDEQGKERKRVTITAAGRTARPARESQTQIDLEADQEVINKVFGGKDEISSPEYEDAIRDAIDERVRKGESRNAQEADWYFRSTPEGKAYMEAFYPKAKKKNVDVRTTAAYKGAYRKAKLSRMGKDVSGTTTGGTSKEHKAGDVVTYKGQRHRVLSVNTATGELKLDPRPLP